MHRKLFSQIYKIGVRMKGVSNCIRIYDPHSIVAPFRTKGSEQFIIQYMHITFSVKCIYNLWYTITTVYIICI